MSNLLVINTSISGDNSASRELVTDYVNRRQENHIISIKSRDLGENPLPHLSGEEMQAWAKANESGVANQLAQLSDDLIAELQWADEIVLALPMYNFDSPSTLSVWIDRVVRAGKTFKYSDAGPVGLLSDKNVVVIATRGGKYAGTPLDTQSQYIKNIFNFIGIKSVEFVYAEGLAMGDAVANETKLWVNKKIDELISNSVD